MSFFFFSRGKLKEKKTVQKWPCHRWWIGLSFFFFLSYTSVYYQKKNLSRVSRRALTCYNTSQRRKRRKKKSAAHRHTCPHHPILLFISHLVVFFFFFFHFEKKERQGHPFVNLGIFIICPCRQSDKYTGENRREYMAFFKNIK